MKKTGIVGAIIFVVYSAATQLAVQSYHAVGEDLLALLLFALWVVAIGPIALCYHWLGLDSRTGSGLGNFDLPAEILIGMFVLNALLGALLGAGLWKLWQLVRRLFAKKEHT